MTNNFDGWKHINTAPKDREVLVWDGNRRHVAEWKEFMGEWVSDIVIVKPISWRGCPPAPYQSLPEEDEE